MKDENKMKIKKSSIHKVKSLMNTRYGWGGRIRTCECSSQSAVSYRLTTPQNILQMPQLNRGICLKCGVDNRVRTDDLQGHNLAL